MLIAIFPHTPFLITRNPRKSIHIIINHDQDAELNPYIPVILAAAIVSGARPHMETVNGEEHNAEFSLIDDQGLKERRILPD